MLETLKNAFRIKEIRTKLFFTFLMIALIRFGSQLPAPGVDRSYFSNWFAQQSGDAFNFFSAFTGGSFEKMSIFALGVSPYITSSIIVQLLTIAIPVLEEMHKDGEEGRKKISAITRYVSVALALIEGTAMAIGFGKSGLIPNMNFLTGLSVVLTLTAGTALLMWIGERITERGVGNGISMILMVNILSSIPSDITGLYDMFMKNKSIAQAALAGLIILAVIVLTIILVILLSGGTRRIPVQYAKKMQGRKMVGGQSTFIPLKVNTAGVIPVIFASSLMSIPQMALAFAGKSAGSGIGGTIIGMLSQNNWFNFSRPVYSLGLIIYIVLIIFFAYFYTSITFNPLEVADNMKRQGGFVPGIRPGKPTSDYLNRILGYLVFIGATGLIIVVLVPVFFNGVFGASVSFGGTSIIIIVGVIIETLKQIESQMLVRNYSGFLKN